MVGKKVGIRRITEPLRRTVASFLGKQISQEMVVVVMLRFLAICLSMSLVEGINIVKSSKKRPLKI